MVHGISNLYWIGIIFNSVGILLNVMAYMFANIVNNNIV